MQRTSRSEANTLVSGIGFPVWMRFLRDVKNLTRLVILPVCPRVYVSFTLVSPSAVTEQRTLLV